MIRQGFLEAVDLIISCDPALLGAAWRSIWISLLAVALASAPGVAIGIMLARRKVFWSPVWLVCARVGMAVPTVFIGLLCFAIFSRRGTLGSLELLYTNWAIVIGEFFLALPIMISLTYSAIRKLDRVVFETAKTLGARPLRRAMTYLREVKLELVTALLTAFSRCFTELGIAMMVGGNIAGRTRTLTTATVLETSQGEFARGMALCLVLVTIALVITLLIAYLSQADSETEHG